MGDWSCRFITCFVTVFATVIAITKDLPDVEGDRKYNIDTLATRLGVRTIAFAGKPPHHHQLHQLNILQTYLSICTKSYKDALHNKPRWGQM